MSDVTNFEWLGCWEWREVIRCRKCGLVQFRPQSQCRRCRVQLEVAASVPPVPMRAPRQPRPSGKPDFGRAIRFWREVRGLKRWQLAQQMGVHRQSIVKLEIHYQEPRIVTCYRYAEGLGIPARVLALTAEALADMPKE